MLSYRSQRALVLAPHADDETLGCGGIIQKLIQNGSNVRVVIASFVVGSLKRYQSNTGKYRIYSGSTRLEEMKKAMTTLGVTDFQILFEENSDKVQYHNLLDTVPREQLVSSIEKQIEDFKPTILVIPSQTKHQDHTALHDAALTASRPYFWSGSVIVYETDGELNFEPNLYVPLSEEELKVKCKALEAYQTQLGGPKHPVSPHAVTTRAAWRAQKIHENYAEAFEIVRLRG